MIACQEGAYWITGLRSYPLPCLARWYTMVAEVTVFPVPGGPWMRLKGLCSTVFTAYTCNKTHVNLSSSHGT